jgi:small neutral amino acid transporter SnatA (MarC family)
VKPEVRRILAWRVARNSFFVLVCSLLLGALILEFYGISIPVLRVAGSTDEIMFVLASLLAVVVIAVCIFLCFAYADRVQRLLRPGGTDIAVGLYPVLPRRSDFVVRQQRASEIGDPFRVMSRPARGGGIEHAVSCGVAAFAFGREVV